MLVSLCLGNDLMIEDKNKKEEDRIEKIKKDFITHHKLDLIIVMTNRQNF